MKIMVDRVGRGVGGIWVGKSYEGLFSETLTQTSTDNHTHDSEVLSSSFHSFIGKGTKRRDHHSLRGHRTTNPLGVTGL